MKIKVMHSQLSLKARSFMLVLRSLGNGMKEHFRGPCIEHILSTNYK